MRHIVYFVRGFSHVILPGFIGVLFARFVPSFYIGVVMFGLFLVLTYLVGANFDWPWRRRP